MPRDGVTVLVVDVLGEELRKIPMGLEVIAIGESQAPRTILSLPPKVYRRGVIDAQMVFTAESRYVAHISLKGSGPGKSRVLSFPIRVGSWYRPLIVPSLMVLGVVALTAMSVIRYYFSSAGRARSRRSRPRSAMHLAGAVLVCCLAVAACQRQVDPLSATLPNVQVVDDHGRALSLGSLRGKVVLLEFIHIRMPRSLR